LALGPAGSLSPQAGHTGAGASSMSDAGSGSSSRICRFFLQGFCRDGERCRFAHSLSGLNGLGGGGPPGGGNGNGNGAASAAAVIQQLYAQQQQQHPSVAFLGGGLPGSLPQSSTVFAFGAPGADAFAREQPPDGLQGKGGQLGSASGSVHSSMSSLAGGLSLVDRSQLGAPGAGGAGAGGSAGGGAGPGGVLAGGGQVRLRDSATGATFNAVLGPVTVGQQQLVLPDDLTFGPPSPSGASSKPRGGAGRR
jgi:hypothetical protein